jgi:hypothetical protein
MDKAFGSKKDAPAPPAPPAKKYNEMSKDELKETQRDMQK